MEKEREVRMEKRLGKIAFIEFGRMPNREGFYRTGMWIAFGFNGGKEGTALVREGFLHDSGDIREGEEEVRNKVYGMVKEVDELLEEAGLRYISELINMPVEVSIEDGEAVSFRILKEVL